MQPLKCSRKAREGVQNAPKSWRSPRALVDVHACEQSQEELKEEMDQAMAEFEEAGAEYDVDKLREQATQFLRTSKAMARLRDFVQVNTTYTA